MEAGPIDPSWLEGDALDRWYRRPTEEVARSRTENDHRAYSGLRSSGWRNSAVRNLQYTAAVPRPPVIIPWPSLQRSQGGGSGRRPPPNNGGASRGGRDDHPPQCAVQHVHDTEKCGRVAKPDVRAICRASAMDRMGYCIGSGGEVGWPPLITRRP